ncbi:MAG: hypothetical protein GEV05_09515 [Betaproteobacteria bacterium]|nr:hypothetical protein [Betaproteobacteria bacterium]
MNNEDSFVGPVNIGNPVEITINALAQKVLELIPESKSRIVHEPLPQDDPRQRKPDISLARERLGWEPTTPLDSGLRSAIAYFRTIVAPH